MRIVKVISIATGVAASQLDYGGSFSATASVMSSTIEPPTEWGPRWRKKKVGKSKKAEDAPETARVFSSPKFRTKRSKFLQVIDF